MSLPAGSVNAELSFKRSPSLDLTLLDVGNSLVAEQAGPSVVKLSADVAAGSYTFIVSGGRCNFTLTVTGA